MIMKPSDLAFQHILKTTLLILTPPTLLCLLVWGTADTLGLFLPFYGVMDFEIMLHSTLAMCIFYLPAWLIQDCWRDETDTKILQDLLGYRPAEKHIVLGLSHITYSMIFLTSALLYAIALTVIPFADFSIPVRWLCLFGMIAYGLFTMIILRGLFLTAMMPVETLFLHHFKQKLAQEQQI